MSVGTPAVRTEVIRIFLQFLKVNSEIVQSGQDRFLTYPFHFVILRLPYHWMLCSRNIDEAAK